jgi:hypothetical protein
VRRVAELLQLVSLVLFVVAAFTVAVPLGLLMAAISVGLVGAALDPRIRIRK